MAGSVSEPASLDATKRPLMRVCMISNGDIIR